MKNGVINQRDSNEFELVYASKDKKRRRKFMPIQSIDKLPRGEHMTYHVGWLPIDRLPEGSPLDDFAAMLCGASYGGEGCLVQRKLGFMEYEYRFIKSVGKEV